MKTTQTWGDGSRRDAEETFGGCDKTGWIIRMWIEGCVDAVLYWESLIDGRFFNRGTNEGVRFGEMLKDGDDGEFGMIGMYLGSG